MGAAAIALSAPPGSPARPDENSRPAPVRFNRDVRPILAEYCLACHGADSASRQAGLRLDREEGLFGTREGAEGPVVVRGKPEASPLYQRMVSRERDFVMPPPKAHKRPKPEEKELIRRWIAEGAVWEPHWSFIKPVRPPLPAVRNERWPRNPVDRFILARLEAEGLSPAPEADRRTLARRVSLDATGLLPEPDLVEAFVNDPAPDAYERLVDRLLESPRWGEHRARYWLDAARYADTHGLHFDNYREMWPYRDWVIAAFNRNQPFDRFTVEQIAGDLLPEATRDQLVATGFHRCNITTNEGGTIPEENLANYARDRVETTSWVWLGLTANCAVCHDHKFDPVTMKDFYSLAAFFRNTTQGALDGNIPDTPPVLVIPRPADEKRWGELAREIEEARAAAAERKKALRAEFDAWAAKARPEEWDAGIAGLGEPLFHLPPASAAEEGPASALVGGARVDLTGPKKARWEAGGPLGPALALDGEAVFDAPGDVGAFDGSAPFSYGAWVRVGKGFGGSGAVFARMDEGNAYRGWDLWLQGNEFGAHLIHRWPDRAIKVVTTGGQAKREQWRHVFVTYDGSGTAAGFRIYVDGKAARLQVEQNGLKETARAEVPFRIGRRSRGQGASDVRVQDVRLYGRALGPAEVARLAAQPAARAFLAAPVEKRAAADRDRIFEARAAGDAELGRLEDRRAALEKEREEIRKRAAVAHIQEEKKGSMPMAHILFRGEYDKPREKVGPAGIGALHPFPEGAPRNRLGLALWLVSPENPLTPRVIVNRFWQEVFGTGIVRTSEDFGATGEPPSHPELLDWLAVEFRDGGWDVKKLFRLLLTSATYRQDSAATPEKLRKDPANRLLSRGPRFRMDAEMIRDAALSAAGLLSPKIGGPSVKPYQPDGVWEAVAMPESNTRFYRRDGGEALYRRSLYTFWKRHAPPASMEILNAPSREVSCLRRERTNTPLHALVTLNDPQFVEAARALAQRALRQARGAGDAAVLDVLARRALARPLSAAEAAVVLRTLEGLRAHYRARPEGARALLGVGEHPADPALDPAEAAAWTMAANQILNLDEFLNK
jgi:hypothetical protein